MQKGSCLCGEVRYQFSTIEGDYVFCHCKSCRKSSGSAFAANIAVPIEKFELTNGGDNIKIYESSPGKQRYFCSVCASPLFTKVGTAPSFVRVRLGSLDTEYAGLPKAHIFMGDKASWEPVAEGIPCFETWPSGDQILIRGSHQPKT